jgi:hypothetical protein
VPAITQPLREKIRYGVSRSHKRWNRFRTTGVAVMSERPILFSGAMVRAILAGRKTQTRRVVQWPDWANPDEVAELLCRDPHCLEHDREHPKRRLRCPYGRRGDRLWVRERWSPAVSSATLPQSFGSLAIARTERAFAFYEADGSMLPPQSRWHPGIHMPRHLSRIVLEVGGVRVERLQDISVRDALAEGLERAGNSGKAVNDWFRADGSAKDGADNARLVFADLWDSINARRGYGWSCNPWVWAIDFRRIVPE